MKAPDSPQQQTPKTEIPDTPQQYTSKMKYTAIIRAKSECFGSPQPHAPNPPKNSTLHQLVIRGLSQNFSRDPTSLFGNFIRALNFAHSALLTPSLTVVCVFHERPQTDIDTMHLWLNFGTSNNTAQMQKFCKALIAAPTDAIIKTISRYGHLGFSSGEDPVFTNQWNMEILSRFCFSDEDRMRRLLEQGAANVIAAPVWFRVLAFACAVIEPSLLASLISLRPPTDAETGAELRQYAHALNRRLQLQTSIQLRRNDGCGLKDAIAVTGGLGTIYSCVNAWINKTYYAKVTATTLNTYIAAAEINTLILWLDCSGPDFPSTSIQQSTPAWQSRLLNFVMQNLQQWRTEADRIHGMNQYFSDRYAELSRLRKGF
ncbi:hypothetical protein K440DRAFT_644716 [Wilcoxina mikolae CBS 423.85]|nr:hypothetical protein K440DRAFT_644716 [Wilcoxina mikolae CBS 423.85]